MQRPALLFFLLLVFIPILTGCPHQVVEIAEESRPPADHRPVYATSEVGVDSILAGYVGAESDTSSGVGAPLVAMDIRSIDDNRYPHQVELRAFVYDSSGRFILGLAPPYYQGVDNWRRRWPKLVDSCNGVATVIDSFTVTEVREDRREPYALGFVLDHSGSMGDRTILRLRSAVARVLGVIKPGDQITTVKFGSGTEIDVPLTADRRRYQQGFIVENIVPPGGGGTALYDAGIIGINEIARAPSTHHRAMILFTDGYDGSSDNSVDSLINVARKNRVPIYTVAYGRGDFDIMRNIATYSGGRFYRIYSYREFPYVFADIYRGLNSYYKISYRPPNCSGIHTAMPYVSLPEIGLDSIIAQGIYDRSLFTPFDPVGSVVLVNIEFDYNEATIRPESIELVQQVATVMNANPQMKIRVRGHTDDQGSPEYNQRLSEQRARSVADELVAMGIEESRLTVEGVGEANPVVPNNTDENRRRNRRTEFVIISR